MKEVDIRLDVYTINYTTTIEYERVVKMMHHEHGEATTLFWWVDDYAWAQPRYLERELEAILFRRFEFVEGGL